MGHWYYRTISSDILKLKTYSCLIPTQSKRKCNPCMIQISILPWISFIQYHAIWSTFLENSKVCVFFQKLSSLSSKLQWGIGPIQSPMGLTINLPKCFAIPVPHVIRRFPHDLPTAVRLEEPPDRMDAASSATLLLSSDLTFFASSFCDV